MCGGSGSGGGVPGVGAGIEKVQRPNKVLHLTDSRRARRLDGVQERPDYLDPCCQATSRSRMAKASKSRSKGPVSNTVSAAW